MQRLAFALMAGKSGNNRADIGLKRTEAIKVMQVNETVSEGLKRELTITIEAAALEEKLSGKLDEMKNQVRLKGFRPGKVPVSHLRLVARS